MANQDSQETVRPTIEPEVHRDGVDLSGTVAGDPGGPWGDSETTVEPATVPVRPVVFHASWASIVTWAALSALLVGFFAFGSVTIYARDGIPRTMRASHVWALFRDDLPEVYHKSLLSMLFYGALALVVIGMAWMVFLALGTRTADVPSETAAQARPTDPASSRF